MAVVGTSVIESRYILPQNLRSPEVSTRWSERLVFV